jgi:hypothetical protein
MILDTQRAMRTVQQLPFCYLCGELLTEPKNIDHVPPSTIFLDDDRHFPLTLLPHVRCNDDRSKEDQSIGQLIGLLHDGGLPSHHRKLRIVGGQFEDGTQGIVVDGLNLRAIIRRWVR